MFSGVQNSEVSFSQGVNCDGNFTFSNNGNQASLRIKKEENKDLNYKVSVIFKGIQNQYPEWRIQINDKPLMNKGDVIDYTGSQAYVIKPYDHNTLEIAETDTTQTSSIWVDLNSKNEICYEPPVVHQKIAALIEKGKIFKTDDDKSIRKIFYSDNIGVILYATNPKQTDIYYANKDAETFTKCEAQKISQCRCLTGDSEWNIKFLGEAHTLAFPLGTPEPHGHGSEISWDKIPLKGITL